MESRSWVESIAAYKPYNVQEEQDKKVTLEYINQFSNILMRENNFAHITSSSWLVNKDRTKVVMIYHNIYQSWAWTGGHADGESDLLHVAIKEAKEETGLKTITPVSEDIYSLELLCVNGHVKRGNYVSSHIHINVTYLLEADEAEEMSVKEDENSGVKWLPLDEAVNASSEPWMRTIYSKLNEKLSTVK